MFIAFLALLGFDVTVAVAAAVVMLSRAWLRRRPAEFVGAIRVAEGEGRTGPVRVCVIPDTGWSNRADRVL